VHIGPFAAFERRVIHQHFASDPEIEAISEEGDEAGRKKMTVRVRQTPITAPGQTQ
jgi:predicted RNA-binding protein Jag